MKRALFIPLIVLILASLACSFGAKKPTAAPAEPTKAAVQAEEATEPPAPAPTEAQPAEKAVEPEPTAAEETDAQAPTETAAQAQEFKDSFDQATTAWSDPLIVTSQAAGHDPFVKVTSGDGKLRFAIDDKETYVYKFLLRGPEAPSTIEVDFQNKGAINTGFAIVCKANQELTSWFEVRVSASDNNFYFYQYDKKRKEEQGKNPYVMLGKGHMKIDEYYPTKPNHIIIGCSDNEITVDVNKGKKKGSQVVEAGLDGNIIGLGVMSADILPGTMDIDSITVR